MADDMTEFLSRWKPAPVDRAAIFFAAGRASRPGSSWKWMALGLLGTQALTLGLWWSSVPAAPQPVLIPVEASFTPQPAEQWEPPRLDPSSYSALMHSFDPEAPPPAEAGTPPLAEKPLTRRTPPSDPRFN